MRGSTRKRGKTWTAYWWAPKLDPATGKLGRQQRSRGGFARQKDAQAFLTETLSDVQTGTYVEPSSQPLAQFMMTIWLPGISGTVRTLTHRRYEQIARAYIAERDIGAVPLRELTAGHLNALYTELGRAGLSIATRRLVHAVLRHALNDAVKWDKLKRNPAGGANPPSLPSARVGTWSARELRTFLEHVAGDRLFALWRLAATTGMRRGELLGLPWRCVDLDGGSLRVEQQLLPTTGGVTFGPPKSKRGERTIALDPESVEALRRHRDVQGLERDLAGPGYEDHDLVFADQLGRPVYPTRLGEWFVKARKAAGIPTGTLHILRHTCATLALERVPLHVVAKRLGDDPKTVLSVYAGHLPNSDAEAAAVVAAAISVDKPLTAFAPEPVTTGDSGAVD